MKRDLVPLLLTVLAVFAQAKTQWALENSTLSYRVTSAWHTVHGVSHSATGKGFCHAGQCDFLVTAPVQSFDSHNSKRDRHMLQVTRGAQFPVVVVHTKFPEAETGSSTIYADLEVQFAGQTANYQHVAFQRVAEGNDVRITGTVPATVSDFKIVPPSLFTVPIRNEIPVQVDMTWRER